MIRAVLWDFGGVLTTSPFESFRRFERQHGLPDGFIRRLNATNGQTNAWARLERSEVTIDEFDLLFAAEARAAGHVVRGLDVIKLLSGELRPEMVEALRRCKPHYKTACLTNNINAGDAGAAWFASGYDGKAIDEVMRLFDVIVQSSVLQIRKPDPRFYEIACDQLGVTPTEAVFLDDLGVNLKPARSLGMTTLKVVEPVETLRELGSILGLDLIGPAGGVSRA